MNEQFTQYKLLGYILFDFYFLDHLNTLFYFIFTLMKKDLVNLNIFINYLIFLFLLSNLFILE